MRVFVNKRSFERSHIRQPKGYGMWAFKIDGKEHFITGKYGEASREACRRAKALGCPVIDVLP
ncbi:MAG: hypothetical protein JXB42_12815 [Deltaproteobacteria bacterium]|nr:hypothetical protein [Deltaproteobacteria bacterium]